MTLKKDSDLLDRIDRKILSVLQQEGRIANVDLAARINLSPTPCLERVRRLEKRGFIQRYVAHLNPNKLNAALVAYIEVSLENTSSEDLNQFNNAIMDLSEVMECSMVAGGFDYLIKIRVADMAGYRQFLGEKLAAIDGVRETRTYVVMEEVKSTHIITIE
jgi:Lrp/AsnC family leucine-responsive transcriptional regulator